MQRPAGGYAARRVGDFENPEAKSPPPPDALRAYARIFGGAPATDADEHDGVAALEDELLSLRNGIDAPAPEAPPAPGRRWKVLAGLGAVIVLGMLSMILIGQARHAGAGDVLRPQRGDPSLARVGGGRLCPRRAATSFSGGAGRPGRGRAGVRAAVLDRPLLAHRRLGARLGPARQRRAGRGLDAVRLVLPSTGSAGVGVGLQVSPHAYPDSG